jgi:hypothetical protein
MQSSLLLTAIGPSTHSLRELRVSSKVQSFEAPSDLFRRFSQFAKIDGETAVCKNERGDISRGRLAGAHLSICSQNHLFEAPGTSTDECRSQLMIEKAGRLTLRFSFDCR